MDIDDKKLKKYLFLNFFFFAFLFKRDSGFALPLFSTSKAAAKLTFANEGDCAVENGHTLSLGLFVANS